MLSLREGEVRREAPAAVSVRCHFGLRCARPAEVERSRRHEPRPLLVLANAASRIRAVTGPGVQHDAQLRLALGNLDAPEQQRRVGAGRGRKRLTALDDRSFTGPAVPPDEGPRLVVSTPHVPTRRRHGVVARAADEGGEHGVAVPPRNTEPDHRAVRADDGTSLAVGEQRVLAERVRRREFRRRRRPQRRRTRECPERRADGTDGEDALVRRQPELRAARLRAVVEDAVCTVVARHRRERLSGRSDAMGRSGICWLE